MYNTNNMISCYTDPARKYPFKSCFIMVWYLYKVKQLNVILGLHKVRHTGNFGTGLGQISKMQFLHQFSGEEQNLYRSGGKRLSEDTRGQFISNDQLFLPVIASCNSYMDT